MIKLPEPFGAIHDSHLTADMAVAPVPVRPSGLYMKPEDFTKLYTEAQLKQIWLSRLCLCALADCI